ncbi:WcaF family extracellular polysaccharide biosynthesis acetyltransferase [Pedobacter agri]|uniref:WcaF family extracellular polysaccharide biosynthesis acetyltransferase n=1 Tax=Pedobacter agri TaxID=454586 RepID=UPI002931085D|nr:WcaF family extracellular polysaccharide biosynthesis acetyltransferase [Pedobacter agri]
MEVRLEKNFDTGEFKVGASWLKQFLWYFSDVCLFKSKLIPLSSVLVFILRLFGAQIGNQVRIKPGIHIKYPWKLKVGDSSWLADCYIENLDWVYIGNNCCISQQAMLMTGNHNFASKKFDLFTKPICIENGVWVGARSNIAPGVTAYSHAVLAFGSTATEDLEAFGIYQGNPATKIKHRSIK